MIMSRAMSRAVLRIGIVVAGAVVMPFTLRDDRPAINDCSATRWSCACCPEVGSFCELGTTHVDYSYKCVPEGESVCAS